MALSVVGNGRFTMVPGEFLGVFSGWLEENVEVQGLKRRKSGRDPDPLRG